jgi:hypothetical protein
MSINAQYATIEEAFEISRVNNNNNNILPQKNNKK